MFYNSKGSKKDSSANKTLSSSSNSTNTQVTTMPMLNITKTLDNLKHIENTLNSYSYPVDHIAVIL